MVRIRNLLYIVIVLVTILLSTNIVSHAASVRECILRVGAKGRLVVEVQGFLQRLKYLRQRPSGYYGRATAEAVKSFQLEHALKVDGIVGPKTMASFRAVMNEGGNLAQITSRGHTGGIKTIPWTIVNQLWEGGETVVIIDVITGRSFQARRLYGYYHADVEPLTRMDTESMLTIYGGKWGWDRRAVVVFLRNYFIAASINGMPHGQKSIDGNGFPGQFCVHFLGSRIHQSGMVDPEHLAMIERAAAYDLNTLNTINQPKQKIPTSSIGNLSQELMIDKPFKLITP